MSESRGRFLVKGEPMRYGLNDFEVGDIITYSTWGGEIRRVLVENKERNIKNDRDGFDGVLVGFDNNSKLFLNGNPMGVWGYCDQILSVEKENANA
jgi:hypothetical protein